MQDWVLRLNKCLQQKKRREPENCSAKPNKAVIRVEQLHALSPQPPKFNVSSQCSGWLYRLQCCRLPLWCEEGHGLASADETSRTEQQIVWDWRSCRDERYLIYYLPKIGGWTEWQDLTWGRLQNPKCRQTRMIAITIYTSMCDLCVIIKNNIPQHLHTHTADTQDGYTCKHIRSQAAHMKTKYKKD